MIKARRHGATTIPPAWLILAALAAAGCAGSERTTPAVLTTPSASLPAHARATQSAGAAMPFGEVQRELAAMRVTHYRHTTRVDEGQRDILLRLLGIARLRDRAGAARRRQ